MNQLSIKNNIKTLSTKSIVEFKSFIEYRYYPEKRYSNGKLENYHKDDLQCLED
jgi:hypothetical protein